MAVASCQTPFDRHGTIWLFNRTRSNRPYASKVNSSAILRGIEELAGIHEVNGRGRRPQEDADGVRFSRKAFRFVRAGTHEAEFGLVGIFAGPNVQFTAANRCFGTVRRIKAWSLTKIGCSSILSRCPIWRRSNAERDS